MFVIRMSDSEMGTVSYWMYGNTFTSVLGDATRFSSRGTAEQHVISERWRRDDDISTTITIEETD